MINTASVLWRIKTHLLLFILFKKILFRSSSKAFIFNLYEIKQNEYKKNIFFFRSIIVRIVHCAWQQTDTSVAFAATVGIMYQMYRYYFSAWLSRWIRYWPRNQAPRVRSWHTQKPTEYMQHVWLLNTWNQKSYRQCLVITMGKWTCSLSPS